MDFERIILIKSKTRLEQLIERYNSKSQARFYLEHSGGNFADYETEHNIYYDSLLSVQKILTQTIKTTTIERSFLPSFIFAETDLIVVVGQDGLVANTAKYVGINPVLAINPDPARNKGVLLPFNITNFEKGLNATLKKTQLTREVTMAQAQLNDGQELLAFNDFYIGKSNHTSARYKISYVKLIEQQSSSGLIISTGAGSTGWLSSVFNQHAGLAQYYGGAIADDWSNQMKWDDNRLCFVVREPYLSPDTGKEIITGFIEMDTPLIIESLMPENGVIFSDGIIDDYLEFNAGKIVEISVAKQKANLIYKS